MAETLYGEKIGLRRKTGSSIEGVADRPLPIAAVSAGRLVENTSEPAVAAAISKSWA